MCGLHYTRSWRFCSPRRLPNVKDQLNDQSVSFLFLGTPAARYWVWIEIVVEATVMGLLKGRRGCLCRLVQTFFLLLHKWAVE